jgi:hypothetical protein
MQNDNFKWTLHIITEGLWVYVVLAIIYGVIYQYIIRKREKYWESATMHETIHAFLKIIHDMNYFEWHKLYLYQILANRDIRYTHIVSAYNDFSMEDRITFWQQCRTKGLYPTFTKIFSEYSPPLQ